MSKKNNKELKNQNNNRELQQQNTPKAIVAQVKASAVFTGPLPPPQILAQYEQISPGFANRIFDFAEEQQKHRFKLEDYAVPESIKVSKLGQIFAFVIALVALGVMVIFASKGMEIAAVATALVLGGGIITTFVTGKINQQNSMYKKAEEILKTKKMIEDSASKSQENSTNS